MSLGTRETTPAAYLLCDPVLWKYVSLARSNIIQHWEATDSGGGFIKLQIKHESGVGRNYNTEREQLIKEINKVGIIEVQKEVYQKLQDKDVKNISKEKSQDGSLFKIAGVKSDIEALKRKIEDIENIENKPRKDKKEQLKVKDISTKIQHKSGLSILCDGLLWEHIKITFKSNDIVTKKDKTTNVRGDFVGICFKENDKELKERAMDFIDNTKSGVSRFNVDKEIYERVRNNTSKAFSSRTVGKTVTILGKTEDIKSFKKVIGKVATQKEMDFSIQCDRLLWKYIDIDDTVPTITCKYGIILAEANPHGASDVKIMIEECDYAAKAKEEIVKLIETTKALTSTEEVNEDTFNVLKLKENKQLAYIFTWQDGKKVYKVLGKHTDIENLRQQKNAAEQSKRNGQSITDTMYTKTDISVPRLKDSQNGISREQQVDKPDPKTTAKAQMQPTSSSQTKMQDQNVTDGGPKKTNADVATAPPAKKVKQEALQPPAASASKDVNDGNITKQQQSTIPKDKMSTGVTKFSGSSDQDEMSESKLSQRNGKNTNLPRRAVQPTTAQPKITGTVGKTDDNNKQGQLQGTSAVTTKVDKTSTEDKHDGNKTADETKDNKTATQNIKSEANTISSSESERKQSPQAPPAVKNGNKDNSQTVAFTQGTQTETKNTKPVDTKSTGQGKQSGPQTGAKGGRKDADNTQTRQKNNMGKDKANTGTPF